MNRFSLEPSSNKKPDYLYSEASSVCTVSQATITGLGNLYKRCHPSRGHFIIRVFIIRFLRNIQGLVWLKTIYSSNLSPGPVDYLQQNNIFFSLSVNAEDPLG